MGFPELDPVVLGHLRLQYKYHSLSAGHLQMTMFSVFIYRSSISIYTYDAVV